MTKIKNYILISLMLLSSMAIAQVVGDYRTVGTGNWSTTSNWQTRVASNWQVAIVVPGSTNSVYIQSGHVITIDIGTATCNDLH